MTENRSPSQAITGHLLRWLVGGMFVVYIIWNLLWLWHGQLPPSLFYGITRFPSATTGLTRSIVALSHGDVSASIAWHPLALPLIFLYLVSLGWLGRQFCHKQKMRLPASFLTAWLGCLLLAWLMKLLGNTAYW